MEQPKVWFITGASKGLGLELSKTLLSRGFNVAATSRNKKALNEAIGSLPESARFLPIEADLSDQASIANAVRQAEEAFGKIDVLVNNAGYGIGGAIEELNDAEARASFEVNVFATVETTRAVLSGMRHRRSGHIINISSIAGFAPATGWAMYAAAKFAIIGLTEVLAEDVKEFGIHATVVAPGGFRTSFLKEGSLVIAEHPMQEYTAVRASHARYAGLDGKQGGDPAKAAEMFIALTEQPAPPVLFFMGGDAYNRAKARLSFLSQGLEQNRDLSFSTDFVPED